MLRNANHVEIYIELKPFTTVRSWHTREYGRKPSSVSSARYCPQEFKVRWTVPADASSQWIGREASMAWLPRPRDFAPLHFFLSGYKKVSSFYADEISFPYGNKN